MSGACGVKKTGRKKNVELPSISCDVMPLKESDNNEPSPVENATEFLSGGYSDIAILKKLRDIHKISLEQSQAILEKAYQQIYSYFEERPAKHKLSVAVEQRSRIAAKAYASEDLRTALTAMEQRDKLLGLHDPETFEQSAACSTLLALIQKSISADKYLSD